MPKPTTWSTWRKRNNPLVKTLWDVTGGVYSIEPTLKSLGFKLIWEERFNDETRSPLKHAKDMIDESMNEVVYHVWRHPQGYCQHINVFYR